MFSKIDKKIIISFLGVAVVLAVCGIIVYKLYTGAKPVLQEDTNQQNTQEEQGDADVQILQNGIEVGGGTMQDGLFVCVSKCGDGICQEVGTVCPDNLNCPCVEDKNECPEDCNN